MSRRTLRYLRRALYVLGGFGLANLLFDDASLGAAALGVALLLGAVLPPDRPAPTREDHPT